MAKTHVKVKKRPRPIKSHIANRTQNSDSKSTHAKAHTVHPSNRTISKSDPSHKAHSHTSKSHAKGHSEKKLYKPFAKRFCPNCGKEIHDGNTFCKDCRKTDFDFKDIKLLLCTNCMSYNYKNKWQKFSDLNKVLHDIVKANVKEKVDYVPLSDEKIEELLSYKAGVHRDFTVNVAVGNDMFDLPATLDVTLCPKCSKKGTRYFEGVLQVRNIDKDIYDFIKNDLAKNRHKGVHINKEIEIDDAGKNIDFYYTDKGYMKIIAEKLRSHFGAVIKHNAQLFSIDWETSKNLYRLNVLVEFPPYAKGDVIKHDGHLYKVVSMDQKIHVLNLETKAKTLIPHKESYDVLKPVQVMLIKKYPEFEILDPNTYYQARLMNPASDLEINDKIRVIIDGGEAWLV